MINFFVNGGLPWMIFLTVELAGLIMAAWKAPGWVKEVGLIALVTGILGTLTGIYLASDDLAKAGEIAPGIIWAGIGVALINTLYGIFIYGVSLIIRILQKPKHL
jgi:biopolymer transport protein ExbB/TolQ